MMSPKHVSYKRKRFLAVTLSVLLGLASGADLFLLNAHAEGESITESKTTVHTLPVTLTCGDKAVDMTAAYLTSTDTSRDTKYPLAAADKQPVFPPDGNYHIYIHDKDSGQHLLVQGAELTAAENRLVPDRINYFRIHFFDSDGITLLSRQYVAGGCEIAAPDSVQNGIQSEWALTPDGKAISPLPAATDHMNFYKIQKSGSPEHLHSYSSEWAGDQTNHWHPCISEGAPDNCDKPAIDIAPHISDNGSIITDPGTGQQGLRVFRCTVCGRELYTEEIPAVINEPVHTHLYKWMSNETEHWQECTSTEGSCDIREKDRAAHSFDNGTVTKEATETTTGEKLYRCTVCGYQKTESIPKLPHTHHYSADWSSDDTSHWHECTCGSKNETAPHTAGEWILDKQATISAEGSRHKECTVCKKVLQTEPIAKLVPPVITSGSGQIFHTGNSRGLTITCSGSLEDFTGVYVDNEAVHKSNYTVASGSTILTLHTAWLDSLAAGTHTVKLAYKDGTSAETQFTIQKTSTVKTGDYDNYIPLVILLILSGGVLIITAVLHKKGMSG